MPDLLHLVKIPLRPDKLYGVARSRSIPLRDLDDGYLCHCILRELWQERAPSPFVLRPNGRSLDVWGYSRSDAAELVEHARAFGDPSLLAAIVGLDVVVSKEMPQFDAGRRLGFLLRACPVVRLAQGTQGHPAGAEVDAFLARCFGVESDVPVSREEVYRDWISRRVNRSESTGATLNGIRVASMARERLVRRTQGSDRRAIQVTRPEVRFEGDLVVVDPQLFRRWLAHGVGRHRAFGFGALILVPPGTSHSQ